MMLAYLYDVCWTVWCLLNCTHNFFLPAHVGLTRSTWRAGTANFWKSEARNGKIQNAFSVRPIRASIVSYRLTVLVVKALRSLATKFVCETREKLVLLRSSFCETRKKQFSLRNFIARLVSHESRYKICVCETHEKQISLLILTRESHENLAWMWFSCQP